MERSLTRHELGSEITSQRSRMARRGSIYNSVQRQNDRKCEYRFVEKSITIFNFGV